MRIFTYSLSLALVGFFPFNSANAQYDPVSVGNWQLSSNITYVGGLVMQGQQSGSNVVQGKPSPSPTPSINGNIPAKSADVFLTYKPSLSRRATNISNFISANRRVNPALGAELERVFAANDVMADLSKGLAVYGLKIDNVADSFTAYWINAWEAAHTVGVSNTNKSIAMRVKSQVEKMMRTSPNFVLATEAQRQEMSETWLIQAALLAPLGKMAADDPALAKVITRNVRKSALASGLDLDAMTLTEDGFVPAKSRKRSDAADVVGADKALASATPAETAPVPSQNWPLLAAIGGASLGGMFLLGKMVGKKG